MKSVKILIFILCLIFSMEYERKPILLICSVGFDERFIVRTIVDFRLGIKSRDGIILFLPRDADPRSYGVINRIEDFIRSYKLNIELFSYEIDIDDFWKGAGRVRKILEEILDRIGPEMVYVMLGGGMRLLILEILIGTVAAGVRGEIIVYKEDLTGKSSFPINILRMEKPSTSLIQLLEKIVEKPGISFSELSDLLKISKSTLHKRLRTLQHMGLVSIEKIGKSVRISPLPYAHFWLDGK